jgi:hypothetical protein
MAQQITDPIIIKVVNYIHALQSALKNNGIGENMYSWWIIQDYMESAGFSNVGASLNNPGNIMWPAKGLKYGSKGPYNKINKTYYAKFKNLDEYVKEKILVLNQNPGRPINATSARDFVNRLKENNYFGKETAESYFNKMKGTAQRLRILDKLMDDVNQNVIIPGPETNPTAGEQKKPFPWWGWALLGLGGIVVLKKVLE